MTSLRAIATLALSLFVLALSVVMAALGTDRDGLFADPRRPAEGVLPSNPSPTSVHVQHIL